MKETTMNRVTTAATSAAFRPIGMIGRVSPEAEETEAEEEAADSLEVRLARLEAEASLPFTEAEVAERKRTFQYLKDFRERKKLGLEHTFECQEEARERARAAVERMLEGDAARSARESEGTMNEEAMVESAGVGIVYVADETGKLVKRRTSAERKTSARRRIPHPVSAADRERIDRNTDRHTRAWYARELLKIHGGQVKPTKAEREALFAYGRLKGWNKKRQK